MSTHDNAHDEYEDEPVRGLPAHLPDGEKMLWQGAPKWQGLARHAYHVNAVAIYFAALLAWRVYVGITAGESLPQALLGVTWVITLATTCLAVLSLLAWLGARNTVYTITTHRVVMRHGIALPMTINIPFTVIEAASLKGYADGMGEIAMTISKGQRVGYAVTWPNVRPWRITRTQPTLRVLPDAQRVSTLLAAALQGLAVTPMTETFAAGSHTLTSPSSAPSREVVGVPVGQRSVAA